MSLYANYAALLGEVLDALEADGSLPPGLNRKPVAVEPPRDSSPWRPCHQCGDGAGQGRGDQSARARRADRAQARGAARRHRSQRRRAGVHQSAADRRGVAARAGDDHAEGERYGLSKVGAGERVNVEYVSANPTGPMHMGHCRGAVVGDALASLARGGGVCGHQGILCQRRRQPGRYARPLGAASLPRGARRGHRRDPRGALPGRLSEAGRGACSRPNMATNTSARPRASG